MKNIEHMLSLKFCLN